VRDAVVFAVDVKTIQLGINRVPLRGHPIRWTTPRLFLAPGLKCSPISADRGICRCNAFQCPFLRPILCQFRGASKSRGSDNIAG
jgi:hypothetical protein